MNNSNLSKTKPAFRTSGSVTGNFGAGRRTGGSQLNDVPANSRESLGSFPTEDEYYNRLVDALNQTTDRKLQGFIRGELRKMDSRRITQGTSYPKGAYCSLDGHHVKPYQ